MSWLRYDDRFTSGRVWDGVSYSARWHYLALVELCGSTGRYDGVAPLQLALGCSDVPDAAGCHAELAVAGVLKIDQKSVTVVTINEHIPPPGERNENLLPRKRANTVDWRKRKCEAGEHSKDCPSATCPAKLAHRRERDTDRVTGYAGTGLDRTGLDRTEASEAQENRAQENRKCVDCEPNLSAPASSLLFGPDELPRCRRHHFAGQG